MPQAGAVVRPGDVTVLGSPTWASFTPTWTASSGGQSLGNGTLLGRYCQSGKIVFFQIKLLFGSTTVRGSGRYSFGGLPVARAGLNIQAVSCYAEAAGGLRYGGAAQVDSGGVFSMNLGTTEITATTPVSWASGTTIAVAGFYESV